MYYYSIYPQLFNFIPRYRFEKIVKKSGGDRYCKHFTAEKNFKLCYPKVKSGAVLVKKAEYSLKPRLKKIVNGLYYG